MDSSDASFTLYHAPTRFGNQEELIRSFCVIIKLKIILIFELTHFIQTQTQTISSYSVKKKKKKQKQKTKKLPFNPL